MVVRRDWSTAIRRGTSLHRLVWGTSWSVVSQALTGGQAIILVPLLIWAWGPETYARWVVLTALISHLALADLGAQNYTGNLLAANHATGDTSQFRTNLAETLSLFLLIGLVLTIATALVTGLGLVFPLPGLGRTLERWEAIVVFSLGAYYLLLAVPGGIWSTVYRATGNFARGAAISNAIRFLTLGVTAAGLLLRATPAALAMWTFVAGLLLTVGIVVDARRVIPECRGWLPSLRASLEGIRHLRGGALHFWLLGLALTLNLQVPVLIAAWYGTPLDVAVFATHRTLVGLLTYVTVVVQGPALPELTFLWSQARTRMLADAVSALVTGLTAATGLAAGALWIGAQWFYPLWTGGALAINPLLLALLSIQMVMAAGWSTATWPLLAANHHQQIVPWALGRSALTFGLALWFAPRFGTIGVVAAGLVADVVCGLWVLPRSASSFLGLRPFSLHRDVALGALMVLPMAAGLAVAISVERPWVAVLGGLVSVALVGRALTELPAVRVLFARQATSPEAGNHLI